MKTAVVALGGNALAPAGEEGTITEQFRHTRESLGAVVALARQGWRLALVHGNGPQVGNMLIQQEVARHLVPPLPLGVLVAATAGWIGYMIQQSLQNALARAGVARQVVTLITQVIVDPEDPALAQPSKPIGRVMEEATAKQLAAEFGWTLVPVPGGWRRVVPSPLPRGIVERDMIRTLVVEGHLVIAAGGGGIPVYRDPQLGWEGVDAVVDKDRAAAVLGRELDADVLLILTDVDGVYENFGSPQARLLRRLTAREAETRLRVGQFGAGSMAPKVEAAIDFVRHGGRRALIARLDRGWAAVEGEDGTEIVPDNDG
jgi:carbamate kinase